MSTSNRRHRFVSLAIVLMTVLPQRIDADDYSSHPKNSPTYSTPMQSYRSPSPSSSQPSPPPATSEHGIDMSVRLCPLANAWRKLPAELYIEFGKSYQELGPGFFRCYRSQMKHNDAVVKHEVGVYGDVPGIVREMWVNAKKLWQGLRYLLSELERMLETFLHYLADSLQSVMPDDLLDTPQMQADLARLHGAIQSADDGYESNCCKCQSIFMRALRRKVRGMLRLHNEAMLANVAATSMERQVWQTRFEDFYDKSSAMLMNVLRSYWTTAIHVYQSNWMKYSDAYLSVLEQM